MNCLIVDVDSLSVFALTKIVESNLPRWKIFSAKTLQEAKQQLAVRHIDVILLDIDLGKENGLTLLAYLQKNVGIHRSQCIVVSSVDDPEKIAQCKALGARGYVLKKDACHAVFPAIRKAIAGVDMPPARRSVHVDESSNDAIRLTHRQRDIIDLLLNGYSNKMIAHALNLSYGTVKNYMFDLMRLTAVNSRLEMAMKLQRSGYKPRKPDQIDRPDVAANMMAAAEHSLLSAQLDAPSRFRLG